MTIQRNAKKPRSEWQELITEMNASGQTKKSWCHDHGVNLKTISNWTRKFRAEQDLR
jgi:hypothetical protein